MRGVCMLSLPLAGRASLSLDSLKYASLAAERLSGSMRWEGDAVKLEETVLVQQGSRCDAHACLSACAGGAHPAFGHGTTRQASASRRKRR